jgi:hypothetical protein
LPVLLGPLLLGALGDPGKLLLLLLLLVPVEGAIL